MPPEHDARATATSISTPSGPLHVSVLLTEGSQSVGSTCVESDVHEMSTAYKPVNVICVRLKAANRAHRALCLRSIGAHMSNPRQSRACIHWPYRPTCVRFDAVACIRVEATADRLAEEKGGARLACNLGLLGTPCRAVSRGLWRRAFDDQRIVCIVDVFDQRGSVAERRRRCRRRWTAHENSRWRGRQRHLAYAPIPVRHVHHPAV